MGSRRVGYEYNYEFSMVDEAEIKSNYKKKLKGKAYLYEFRTKFVLKRRPEEGVADDGVVVMDSERYDARLYEGGKKFGLYLMGGFRMKEYWMSYDEILYILDEAIDFAKADPHQQQSQVTAVVVSLEVCTVQQDGESLGACMDRAIRATNLVPLYLWPYATMERKPMTSMLSGYLRRLDRFRVEDIDQGSTLMRACPICSRDTTIGAQISKLPKCKHAFHSHCIVRCLEDNNLCPTCQAPAYHHEIATPFTRHKLMNNLFV
ncbi:E3 ubiquitin-protein ligase rnf126 [Phtheirospermum japonicum]|uniref:E3 ubiquitin-protein ligase rnf126 n=1 Tax=Phtheirospermum japonicum TaxID=374723 RepID=A0A830BNA2_9LAMI|nr:E3 ubiquitin-protein ligase rnf126 [Phtheirospermum japonicum]